MAAIATGISVEEYLALYGNSRYVEYVDGELKEKPVTGYQHGIVQGSLFNWFRARRKEWDILVSVETHTLVAPTRFRLPDVVVVRKSDKPQGNLTKPPLIAIEVLSPGDSYTDLKERASDLRAMGTQNIWLLDEKCRTAEVWTGTQWQLFEDIRLTTVDSPAYLDLDWLWAEVDDE